jgi:hypothetical protein
MKAVLSVTLILALATSTIPLAAQEKASPREAVGPLAQAITREALRLAATPEPGQSAGDRWPNLTAGTDVLLTVRGKSSSLLAGVRTYVSVEQSRVTFLDLTDPDLPTVVAQRLRWIATNHPELFVGVGSHSFHYGDVRVGPDGIFFADQKVSTLDQVVQGIERDQIVAVKKVVTPKPKQGGLSTGAKIAIGAAIAAAAIVVTALIQVAGLQ